VDLVAPATHPILDEDVNLSDFIDNSVKYHSGTSLASISGDQYKFRDDSVKPRRFLGANDEDEINAILSDHDGHSLHEIIDGDDPLRPIIDFDLPKETLNAFEPSSYGAPQGGKLTPNNVAKILYLAFSEACKEVFFEWDKNSLTLASSSDAKKISFHVSTTGMRLKNIPQVAVFTELVRKKLPAALQGKTIVDNIANKRSFSLRMLGFPKYNEKTKEHVRVKKAILPKDGTVYDFMLRPPNDESPVADSPLLVVSEIKSSKRGPEGLNEVSQHEFELVVKLLKENSIEGYDLSYPSDDKPGIFPLIRISPSHCLICKREHTSDNAYIRRNKKSYSFSCHRANQETNPGERKPSFKLTLNETTLEREKKFPSPIKLARPRISDPNDHFVWGDLIDMCGTTEGKEKYTRSEVYGAIQATIACIQNDSKMWVLKNEDLDGGLRFKISYKLDIASYKINIVELGEPVKLTSLINRAVEDGTIRYRDINFLPYPPNSPISRTKFFNLFMGFKAQPVSEINPGIIDPILWHSKNIISDGNMKLNKYFWNWLGYLVQFPSKKPGTIQVLRSLPGCGKNILIDFIGKKVLGSELFYATSDLGKILGRFNSCIQGRKLILMNETGMSSGDWHKYNDHLKSLITEDYLKIERKGLEPIVINDYAGFMITSNHDTPLRVEKGDRRIVCYDVSPRCKGNITYFKRLAKVLDHPNAPSVVMSYLLSLDLSDFDPQEIPATKMKKDTMRDQLSNPTRFIIDYVAPWPANSIKRSGCEEVYQDYLEWCGCNGEKVLTSKVAGKNFSQIGIERMRSSKNIPVYP
jgi:hypothetical protein